MPPRYVMPPWYIHVMPPRLRHDYQTRSASLRSAIMQLPVWILIKVIITLQSPQWRMHSEHTTACSWDKCSRRHQLRATMGGNIVSTNITFLNFLPFTFCWTCCLYCPHMYVLIRLRKLISLITKFSTDKSLRTFLNPWTVKLPATKQDTDGGWETNMQPRLCVSY